MADLLEGAKLKLVRAREHIDDLDSRIKAFLSEKPYALILRKDPIAGDAIIRIKAKTPIPNILSLVIGDAVHNLRTALDHTLFALIGNKVENPKLVQFPFAPTVEELEKTIKKRSIDIADPNVTKAIRRIKPYQGGNDTLYGLHLLDIEDKHKLLLAIGGFIHIDKDQMPELKQYFPNNIQITGEIRLGTSGVFLRYRIPCRAGPRVDQELKIKTTSAIWFGTPQPFGTSVVVPKLREIANAVEGAICTIEEAAAQDVR